MQDDTIVTEVRKARAEIWKECNHNLDTYFENSEKHIEQLKKEGWKILSKDDLIKT